MAFAERIKRPVLFVSIIFELLNGEPATAVVFIRVRLFVPSLNTPEVSVKVPPTVVEPERAFVLPPEIVRLL